MTIGKYLRDDLITISDDERRRHIYIVGATGAGKSTLLERMMLDDFLHNRPFALLDPHGDLSISIADRTPPHLMDDVLYLDPLDPDFVVGYNPLITVPVEYRSQLTAHILSTFHARWLESWGPRMSYILGHAIRLLLDFPNATLLDINVLLVNDSYRTRLLSFSTDRFNKRFWEEEYARYEKRFRLDAIAPIQNKAGVFSADINLRAVIGQKGTINLPHLMNNRKYLIANLNKAMGAEPSSLLGSFLTTAFAQAAQARSTIPQSERIDFTLYVDEFQNFATTSFASILSEARKWRLNLVLANQFLSQIPEDLRRAVLGNVSTLIVFRVSAEDAAPLSLELGHTNPATLSQTANYHAWVKRSAPSEAILIETLPLPPTLGRFKSVQARTRARQALPRKKVEAEIARSIEGT